MGPGAGPPFPPEPGNPPIPEQPVVPPGPGPASGLDPPAPADPPAPLDAPEPPDPPAPGSPGGGATPASFVSACLATATGAWIMSPRGLSLRRASISVPSGSAGSQAVPAARQAAIATKR